MNLDDARGKVVKRITNNGLLERVIQQEAETKKYLSEKFGEDFEKRSGPFNLSKAEQGVIQEWVQTLKPEILALQAASGVHDPLGDADNVYYGAAGGGLKYSFTPTGLGNIVEVTESTTGKTLNVSDACQWYFYG